MRFLPVFLVLLSSGQLERVSDDVEVPSLSTSELSSAIDSESAPIVLDGQRTAFEYWFRKIMRILLGFW